jgi:hypothetical protein
MLGQETLTKTFYFGLLLSKKLDKNAFTAKNPIIKRDKEAAAMKKPLPATDLISTLSIVAVVGTILIDSGEANFAFPKEAHNPVPSQMSPKHNMKYNASEIQLTFVVLQPTWAGHINELTAIQLWLDGNLQGQSFGEDVSKTFSLTLSKLSKGKHYSEVTANASWNIEPFEFVRTGSSGKICFTVEAEKSTPYPITLTAISISTVAGLAVIFLAYIRRRLRWKR